jgi:hypothetical protein
MAGVVGLLVVVGLLRGGGAVGMAYIVGVVTAIHRKGEMGIAAASFGLFRWAEADSANTSGGVLPDDFASARGKCKATQAALSTS